MSIFIDEFQSTSAASSRTERVRRAGLSSLSPPKLGRPSIQSVSVSRSARVASTSHFAPPSRSHAAGTIGTESTRGNNEHLVSHQVTLGKSIASSLLVDSESDEFSISIASLQPTSAQSLRSEFSQSEICPPTTTFHASVVTRRRSRARRRRRRRHQSPLVMHLGTVVEWLRYHVAHGHLAVFIH